MADMYTNVVQRVLAVPPPASSLMMTCYAEEHKQYMKSRWAGFSVFWDSTFGRSPKVYGTICILGYSDANDDRQIF